MAECVVPISLTKTAAGFGMVVDSACYVTSYSEESVAEKEGVPIGCKIKMVNEIAVAGKADLVEALQMVAEGEEVELAIDVNAKRPEGAHPVEEGEPPLQPEPEPEPEDEPEAAPELTPEPGPEPDADGEPAPSGDGGGAVEMGVEGPSAREVREAELKAMQEQQEAEAAAAKAEWQAKMMERVTEVSMCLGGKEAQATAKLLTSSMDRELVMEGMLRKQGDHKISPRHIFLFDDFMLFCRDTEKKKKGVVSHEYEIRKVLDSEALKSARVRILDHQPSPKQNAFTVFYGDAESTLYAKDGRERNEWVSSLKRVFTQLLGDSSDATAYGSHHQLVEGSLWYAALVGDASLAETILDNPAVSDDLLDAKDEFGATPLHIAASNNNDAVAALLLLKNASGHAMHDNDGRTAVHVAALHGHADIIDVMGEQGIDMECPDTTDTTPLQVAITNKQMMVAKMMVSHGVEPDRCNKDGWSGLHIAAAAGHANECRQWITVGADSNKPTTAGAPRTKGYTPLLLAAQAPPGAAEETIQILLQHNADPNFAEPSGKTALVLAREVDSESAAECLVRHGADFEPIRAALDETTVQRYEELRGQHEADMKRKADLQRSAESAMGAQNLNRDCVVSGWMMAHGSTKWNRRFLVVTKSDEDGVLMLHRYELDTGEEPLQSVPLSLDTCAVEKVEGRIPEEFGVLVSGVGQAATSRKGGGLKAAFGRKVGQAAAKLHKEEAGMYRLSVPSREEQTKWVQQLMRCDIGGDIQEAQRIEEEKRVEQVALEEKAAEEFARTALLDGAAEGRGGAGGGMAGTSKLLSENKDMLKDNIEKLGQMSDQTEQMANDAMDFKDMATQMRQMQQHKSRFGF